VNYLFNGEAYGLPIAPNLDGIADQRHGKKRGTKLQRALARRFDTDSQPYHSGFSTGLCFTSFPTRSRKRSGSSSHPSSRAAALNLSAWVFSVVMAGIR